MRTRSYSGRISRRKAAEIGAAVFAAFIVGAHTPYGQWTVYRQRNLFIVASGTDAQAVTWARSLAGGLARELPESHARMTKATDAVRIASLLVTEQLDVAVVSRDEAAGMLAGSGMYGVVGPVQLRALAALGEHVLVTIESFAARHAYLIAAAVEHLRIRIPVAASHGLADFPVPTHLGAALYYRGEPLPNLVDRNGSEPGGSSGSTP